MTPAHRLAIVSRLDCDWEAHELAVEVLREERRRERISTTMTRRWADATVRARITEGRRRWLDGRLPLSGEA